jgi:hypothetical protein
MLLTAALKSSVQKQKASCSGPSAVLLDTDEAWEAFKKLENSYFGRIEPASLSLLLGDLETRDGPRLRQSWLRPRP